MVRALTFVDSSWTRNNVLVLPLKWTELQSSNRKLSYRRNHILHGYINKYEEVLDGLLFTLLCLVVMLNYDSLKSIPSFI